MTTDMPTTTGELQVGDLVTLTHGPFRATWKVIELIDVGARLRYEGDVVFAGYGQPLTAPNGNVLTTDPAHSFLGRAHFASAQRAGHPDTYRRQGPA